MLASRLKGSKQAAGAIEFVSASTNRVATVTSITVTAPSGIQENDILVSIWHNPSGTDVSSAPSGWVLLDSALGGSGIHCYYKIATNSEPADYTFTLVSSQNQTIGVAAYRNASSVDVIGTIQLTTSSTTITAPSITLATDGALICLMGNDNVDAITTPPSGMTNRFQNNGGPSVYGYDLIPSGTGATGNKTATLPNARDNGGLLIQLI